MQLGLPYGVANHCGLPSERDAVALIRTALSCGIREVDTARAYGDAERRIGLALEIERGVGVDIVTKLDPMRELSANDPPRLAIEAASLSVQNSLRNLGREKLDVLLLHRADHREWWGGAIWRFLREERDEGRVGRIGVSVQSPAEALAVIGDPDVDHIQLPFNVLDHRWRESQFVEAARTRPDVVIHARSVLLQGLLIGISHAAWPRLHGKVDPKKVITVLSSLAGTLHRTGLVDLCTAFARAQGWIDGIIIGMESGNQLVANLECFCRPPLTASECAEVTRALPRCPENLLDPSRWPVIRADDPMVFGPG